MSYAEQQRGLTGTKLVALIIALAIVGGIGAVMVIGLAINAVKQVVERVTTVDIEEPPPPEPDEPPPPPPEQPQAPPPPVAPPPPISIAPAPPPIQTQATIPPPAPPAVRIPPPAPPAAPPAPPSQARGASPKNERSWFARIQDNYPARALREGTEGVVGVRVTVTDKGRAANCQVTSSSGSDILDQAACRDLERYGQFNPALDDAGNPTTGVFATRISYRIN
ncbi:MAG: TonB family protein [Erythrobacter sp.]